MSWLDLDSIFVQGPFKVERWRRAHERPVGVNDFEEFQAFAFCKRRCYEVLVRAERGCPPPGPSARTLCSYPFRSAGWGSFVRLCGRFSPSSSAPAELGAAQRGSSHRFDECAASTSRLEFAKTCDGRSTGTGDLVLQCSGVFTTLQQ